jgi:hypothetical protein
MNIPQAFALGQLGEWKDKWFRVTGRLRFADDESFWDEWCLEFSDGTHGWLEREDGETYITIKKRLLSPVPPWQNIQVGLMLEVNGEGFFVMEKTQARITGYEGQLPFPVQVGERKLFVDGNMSGRPASLEWGQDEIEFGVGHLMELGDLNFRISEF